MTHRMPNDDHWDFDRKYERDQHRERQPFRRQVADRPLANHAAVQDGVVPIAPINPPLKLDRCRLCFEPVFQSEPPGGNVCESCEGRS